MIKIVELTDYTIPLYGNTRMMPYGKLTVDIDGKEYTSPIKEDGSRQYITANRKRYYVINIGGLHSPHFILMDEYDKRERARTKAKERILDILKGMFKDSNIDFYEKRYVFKKLSEKCVRKFERINGAITELPDERTLKDVIAETLLESVQV